jgi:hypothetical protein
LERGTALCQMSDVRVSKLESAAHVESHEPEEMERTGNTSSLITRSLSTLKHGRFRMSGGMYDGG